MGYNVEYVSAGYYPQMTALEDDTITATLEIWSSNIGENYDKALATGKVIEIGDLGLEPREAWMYPKYVEAQCPGLPDWEALKNCADLPCFEEFQRDCPRARETARSVVLLPTYPRYAPEQQQRTVEAIRSFFGRA